MKSLRQLHIPSVEKTAIRSFSRRVKKSLGSQLIDIKLYGSKAREKFRKNSDIDIFILIKKNSHAKSSKVSQAETDIFRKYEVILSTVVFDQFEEKINRQLRSPFFESVSKEGINI